MLAEWMSWMADAYLHTPCQTSDPHMPAVTRDQPLSPSEANSGSIPEAFEDSEDSEDNIGRDGMPDLHRSKCSAEMARDIHNTYRNTHNRHSSGELRIEVPCHRRTRIEVRCKRRTHTCPIPDP